MVEATAPTPSNPISEPKPAAASRTEQPAVFTFVLDNQNPDSPGIVITSKDTPKSAYYASFNSGGYDIRLLRGATSSGPVVSWINIHDKRGGNTDLVFPVGFRTEIKCESVFRSRYGVQLSSPSPPSPETAPADVRSRPSNGRRMFYWQSAHFMSLLSGGAMKLVDEQGEVYAQFVKSMTGGLWGQFGKLSFCRDGLEDVFLDQVVASCVSVTEMKKREKAEAASLRASMIRVLN